MQDEHKISAASDARIITVDFAGVPNKRPVPKFKYDEDELGVRWYKTSDGPVAVQDMPDAVLDGRLGDICAKRLKGLPLAYAWPALVTVASALVPTMKARTNVYCALVGAASTGKSVAGTYSCSVLGMKEPVLIREMAGSAEGLLKFMGDANGGPRLVFPDELSHLLAKSAIDRASFPYVLNRAYYETIFGLVIAKGKHVSYNCRLSVLGGIVEDNFQNSFGHTTTAGLHDRFMFGLCPTGFEYCFRDFVGPSERISPSVVSIDPEVWEMRDEWKKINSDFVGRVAENAIRVAAICASFSGLRRLGASQLGPALAFCRYQATVTKYLQPNPGENTDAKCAFAVMNFLKQRPEEWLKQREVYRSIHATRYGPGAYEKAIRNLEMAGDIEVIRNKRPAMVRSTP